METETPKNYLDAIRTCLHTVLRCDPQTVSPETLLIADLQMESIDIVDLFFELEKFTGIEIQVVEVLQKSRASGAQRFDDLRVRDILNHFEGFR